MEYQTIPTLISSVNLHQTEASELKLINSPAATNKVKE